MYKYNVFLKNLLQLDNSLLLGPRQTGKSSLVASLFPNALNIDLLNPDLHVLFEKRPNTLIEMVESFFHNSNLQNERVTIVLDEIQKNPILLNVVQSLISRYQNKIHFILTGSSARKLVRAGSNMLGGRAQRVEMLPLSYSEIQSWLEKRKIWHELFISGCMPAMASSSQPRRKLKNYLETYVKEEIAAEGIVRNVSSFRLFLTAASFGMGDQVVFENVASDSGVPARTVRLWFEILEDTLLGTLLPCLPFTKKRKPSSSAKFYLFDVGFANYLKGVSKISPASPEWGKSLEHLVFMELKNQIRFLQSEILMFYWRTSNQSHEVDFVLCDGSGNPKLAIEVKSSQIVRNSDVKGLLALAEEFPAIIKILVCDTPQSYETPEKIRILPIETFLLSSYQLLVEIFD